jgi:ABC-type amino acid transport system permease subunit
MARTYGLQSGSLYIVLSVLMAICAVLMFVQFAKADLFDGQKEYTGQSKKFKVFAVVVLLTFIGRGIYQCLIGKYYLVI